MAVRRTRWPVLVDLLLALVLAAVAGVDLATRRAAPEPWAVLVGVTWMALLGLRSSAPFAAVLGMAAGALAYALLDGVPANGGLWSFASLLLIAFTVGSRLDRWRRWVGGAVLLTCVYVLQLATAARSGAGSDVLDVWVSPFVLVGGPLVAGALLRRARQQTALLRRLQAELQEEREARVLAARLEERTRIARELHDVISHSVSVMVVQAGAAELLLPADAPARAPLHEVRQTGKQALTELRRQLGVLRDPDAFGPPAPLPTLADLGRLAGPEVVVECDAESMSDLPPGVALTAYRVVQEALTNARRHASGAPVRVQVGRGADGLDVEVVNGPCEALPELETGGDGHGLTGMAERIGLYAGTFATGATPDGGWRVHARLPEGPAGPASGAS